MEWISFKDRLPDPDQRVDLWLVPKDEKKSRRFSWKWEKGDTANITISGCKVTHWMPLPEPPK